jgi:uncharacterized damage-inducible protein DinB
MANELASKFSAGIAAARAKIDEMDSSVASAPVRPGGWNSKQLLGHLIDSALNNHQRFVRGALDGKYQGPTYEQHGWVNLHGYDGLPWNELVGHWQRQNDLLCAVVERIPEDKYDSPCQVGTDAPVTLRFLAEDYLVHLHHHVDQIAGVTSAGRLFVGYSLEKIGQMSKQISECVQGLSEEQIWERSGENANSIGNLLLHLAGNIRQWIGHGVGGLADVRERDKEFAARGGRSTQEVLGVFQSTVAEAMQILQQMPLQRLTERTKPQNREVAVLEAIYQVVGHLMLHTGQIIFATKQITGKDLGFFARDKNTAR